MLPQSQLYGLKLPLSCGSCLGIPSLSPAPTVSPAPSNEPSLAPSDAPSEVPSSSPSGAPTVLKVTLGNSIYFEGTTEIVFLPDEIASIPTEIGLLTSLTKLLGK